MRENMEKLTILSWTIAFNKKLPVNLNIIFTVCEPNCLFNMHKKIVYRNIFGLT